MIDENVFLEKLNVKPYRLAAAFYLGLNTPVQNLLRGHLINPSTPISTLADIYIDYGYSSSISSIRNWFYYLHDIEPEKNKAKERPLKIDTFRESLSEEQDEQLMETLDLPNPSIDTILNVLKEFGYDGGWASVRKWYERAKKRGEKAKRINILMQEYKGVDQSDILNKLLIDSLEQLDMMQGMLALDGDQNDLSPKEVLKVYPAIAREIRACIEALDKKERLSDYASAEKNGAMYVVEKLLETFKGQPAFYDPIKVVCDGVMLEVTSRDYY